MCTKEESLFLYKMRTREEGVYKMRTREEGGIQNAYKGGGGIQNAYKGGGGIQNAQGRRGVFKTREEGGIQNACIINFLRGAQQLKKLGERCYIQKNYSICDSC